MRPWSRRKTHQSEGCRYRGCRRRLSCWSRPPWGCRGPRRRCPGSPPGKCCWWCTSQIRRRCRQRPIRTPSRTRRRRKTQRSGPHPRRTRRPRGRWRCRWGRRAQRRIRWDQGLRPGRCWCRCRSLFLRDNVPAVGSDERAGGGELIDSVVGGIGDVHIAGAVGGNTFGGGERPGAAAVDPVLAGGGAGLKFVGAVAHAPAIGLDERAGGRELLNPVVAGIGDVDIAEESVVMPWGWPRPVPPRRRPSIPILQVVVHVSHWLAPSSTPQP